MHSKPFEIIPEEWDRLAENETVRASWALDADERGPALAARAFGARFNVATLLPPGSAGDLFVLAGDVYGTPVTLVRDERGDFRVVE